MLPIDHLMKMFRTTFRHARELYNVEKTIIYFLSCWLLKLGQRLCQKASPAFCPEVK